MQKEKTLENDFSENFSLCDKLNSRERILVNTINDISSKKYEFSNNKIDLSKTSIGSWITLNHFSIVEIMADAGFDWLCIDLEHSVIDLYEAEILIAAIQSKSIKPFGESLKEF